MNDWILTYTGKKFYPMRPQIEDICIEDIAHALSNLCRFNGHCKEFYSVAQHSMMVSNQIMEMSGDVQQQFAGLLHDASEAYLCDVPRPIKYTASFYEYRVAELKLQAMIYKRFGVIPNEQLIKLADDYLLRAEAFFLLPDHSEWKPTTTKPKGWMSLN